MMPAEQPDPDAKADTSANAEFEKEVLGFYLTTSPLHKFPQVKLLDVLTSDEILEASDGDRVRFAGVILEVSRRKSKKGNFFATLRIEDTAGRMDAIVFSDPLKKIGSLLQEGRVLLFTGRVIVEEREAPDEEGQEKEVKVSLDNAVPIQRLLERPKRVTLHLSQAELSDPQLHDALKRFIQEHPGDVPVAFELPGPRPKLLVSRQFKLSPDPEVIEALRHLVPGARVGLI